MARIKVIWKEVPGVEGYNVKRCIGEAGIYERINQNLIEDLFYIDTDIEDNTKYYYKVEAIYSSGTIVKVASATETDEIPQTITTKSLLLYKHDDLTDHYSTGDEQDPINFGAIEDGTTSEEKQIFIKNISSNIINSIVLEPYGVYKDWIQLWPTQSGLDDATPGASIKKVRNSSDTGYVTKLGPGEWGSFWTQCSVPSSQINGIYLSASTKIRGTGEST